MCRNQRNWVARILSAAQFLLIHPGATVCFSQQPQTSAVLIKRAEQLIAEDRQPEAQSLLLSILQRYPSNVAALRDLSLLLLLSGDDEGALVQSKALLRYSPRDDQGVFVKAISLANLGRNSEATQMLSSANSRALVAADPLLRAVSAVVQKRCTRDPTCLMGSSEAERRALPEYPDVFLAAQTFRAPALRGVAVAWLDRVRNVQNAPSEVRAHADLLLGDESESKKELLNAEKYFREAVALDPCNVHALTRISELKRRSGDRSGSDQAIYQAKMCPASSRPDQRALADSLMNFSMFVDARSVLERLDRDGDTAERVLYQEGLCQFRVGDSQAAEATFRRALQILPNSDQLQTGLAIILLSTSRLDEGKRILEGLVSRSTSAAAAYFYLADLERGNGELARAESLLQQAIRYAPDDARPYAALGRLHTQQQKFADARVDLDHALKLDKDYAIAHFYLATLLRKQGQVDLAAEENKLYRQLHEQETSRGIIGLRVGEQWDYPGFLPTDKETQQPN